MARPGQDTAGALGLDALNCLGALNNLNLLGVDQDTHVNQNCGHHRPSGCGHHPHRHHRH